MLGMKRVVIWLGLVLGILVGLLVAVNVIDEPLKPEVLALLGNEARVPAGAVEGYKYSLGLRVPPDQDPALKGNEIYKRLQGAVAAPALASELVVKPEENSLKVDKGDNPCKDKLYCYKAVFEKEGEGIASYLEKNKVALQRFDKLISLKEMSSDLRPSLSGLAVQGAVFLEFSKVKYVQLSALLHEKRVEEVASALKEINVFFKNSLNYEQTFLDTIAMLEILKDNREFMTVASRGYPELKAFMGEEGLEGFKLDLNFDAIVSKAAAREFKVVSEVLAQPMNPRTFEMANIKVDSQGLPKWQERAWEPVLGAFLKRNQTLNLLYSSYATLKSPACLASQADCDDPGAQEVSASFGYLINPIGKSYLRMFRPSSVLFRKLKESVASLNSPLES